MVVDDVTGQIVYMRRLVTGELMPIDDEEGVERSYCG